MNQDIINLLRESFLSDKAKDVLIQTYIKYGETEPFFKQFDLFFREAVAGIYKKSEEAIFKFEQESQKARENFLSQKAELEKKLNAALAATADIDLKKINSIWQKYYEKNKKLYSDYRDELEKINRDIYLDAVK